MLYLKIKKYKSQKQKRTSKDGMLYPPKHNGGALGLSIEKPNGRPKSVEVLDKKKLKYL